MNRRKAAFIITPWNERKNLFWLLWNDVIMSFLSNSQSNISPHLNWRDLDDTRRNGESLGTSWEVDCLYPNFKLRVVSSILLERWRELILRKPSFLIASNIRWCGRVSIQYKIFLWYVNYAISTTYEVLEEILELPRNDIKQTSLIMNLKE